MTFAKRAIRVQFTLRDGTLDGKHQSVDFTGLRAELVHDQQGDEAVAADQLNMRVFGVPLSVMNEFSTNTVQAMTNMGNRVSIAAGNEGGPLHSIFDGTILTAYPDFSGQPDVSFNVSARSGYLFQLEPAAPNSFAGQVDVAAAIEALATRMGFGFTNNGVRVHLNDQYLSGSLMAQVNKLVEAAGIACVLSNNVISIWPNGGAIDDLAIDVGPTNGLVSYPQFQELGINVKTEFRPDLKYGRIVNVTSSVQRASGQWYCLGYRHELSTLADGGPWFTTANLNKSLYAPR